ncbi:MAG: amidohydrolase, partial [Peptostreptococcaceae bacterium]|nr:amidohydrolase [Peptostreptococcaceae bacterium]
KIMCEVLNDMVSKGITSINTYAAKIWNYDEDLGTYRDLEKQGLLPLRVIVSLDTLFEPENRDRTNQTKDVFNKVKYGSFKLFTDGSLGARSAALIEPYSDDPDNRGILVEKKDLIRDLQTAYELGLQPAIHAIGDRALEITLEAIEYVLKNTKSSNKSKENQEKRLPFRIIHAQVVNKDQLERMKKLPVVLDIQPIFLTTDLYWIESRLGKERVKTSYLWKTMMDAGLMMAGGSDCPVESYEPLKGIYAAVTRQDFKGYPEGGWEPEEKLSVYEAVCLFTKNIAYTTGDQDVLGTIENNKFADLVLLDSNPFEIEVEKIKDIKVLKTFVAGKQIFQQI